MRWVVLSAVVLVVGMAVLVLGGQRPEPGDIGGRGVDPGHEGAGASSPLGAAVDRAPEEGVGDSRRRTSAGTPVRFRAYCPVLGGWTSKVWRHHGLVGGLRDDRGHVLRRLDEPWKPVTAVLPGKGMLVVPGYTPKALDPDDAERSEDGGLTLGDVVLVPDAGVTASLSGLPAVDRPWVEVRLHAASGEDEWQPVATRRLASPAGRASLSAALPSGLGLRALFESERRDAPGTEGLAQNKVDFTLGSGEHRQLAFDISWLPTFEVELVGLPEFARGNQLVEFASGTAVTDARGRCRFLAVSGGRHRMRLMSVFGRAVWLEDADNGGDRWTRSMARARVRPATPLLAVRFHRDGEAVGGPRGIGLRSLHDLADRAPLARPAVLQGAETMHATVARHGSFTFEPAAAPQRSGVLEVALPDGFGTVVAEWKGAVPEGWGLYAWPGDAAGTWLQEGGVSGVGTATGRRFGLRPGRWSLLWSDGMFRWFVAYPAFDVEAGRTVERSVAAPGTLTLHGRFSNWSHLPEVHRPVTVTVGGAAAAGLAVDDDGTFTGTVTAPAALPPVLTARGPGPDPWPVHVDDYDPRSGRLEAHLATDHHRVRFRVRPRFGGRPTVWVAVPRPSSGPGGLVRCTAVPRLPDGSFEVLTRRPPVAVLIQEDVGDAVHRARGWAYVSPGSDRTTLDPGGREVSIVLAEGAGLGGARPTGPGDHPLARAVAMIHVARGHAEEAVLWVPDSSVGVETNDRVLPVADLPDTLVVGGR